LRAQLRGDPLTGTAFAAARVLLVERPGPWGRSGLPESRVDPAVTRALRARANQAGVRIIAIRRPGRTPVGGARRWAYVDTRDDRQQVGWGRYEDDAELTAVPLDGTAGEPDDAELYLVCTHGRHDPCCALRGRPVAAALARERPGQVWECSHIGGERFAANVLLLPSGLVYGRVLPFAAPEFVAAHEAGEVLGALLRGRVGLPPVAQAALAYGYEQLAVRERDAVRVVHIDPIEAGRARVELIGPHGRLLVTVRVERIAASGLTCANPGRNAYLTYHPERIDPIG
jgi:hypothetical protein